MSTSSSDIAENASGACKRSVSAVCSPVASCDDDFSTRLNDYRTFLLAIANAEIRAGMRRKLAPSDLVQETMIKGIELSPTFRGTSKQATAAWLRTILLRLLANYRRAFFSHKRNLNLEVALDNQIVNPRHKSPSQVALNWEESQALAGALNELPDSYRKTLELRHRDHLSFADIANCLNKTEAAARKIWKRALVQLKREMMRYDSENL